LTDIGLSPIAIQEIKIARKFSGSEQPIALSVSFTFFKAEKS